MLKPAIWTAIYADSLPRTIRKLHALGWNAFECSTEHLVEIAELPDATGEIEAVRAALTETHSIMPQAHALLRADIAHPDPTRRNGDIATVHRHIDICAQLGVRNVVIHPGGAQGYNNAAERADLLKLNTVGLRQLADHAGELGLTLAVENMPPKGGDSAQRFGAAPADILETLHSANHPALGITLDTEHAYKCRLDMVEVTKAFGPWLKATHISDTDGSVISHRIPGAGKIDWIAFMAALQETGYAGIFNLEIPGERHPVAGIMQLKISHALAVTEWLVSL